MPKNNIDYSNTIIYKIYCNDETISDVYVGHTTNFYVRKYQHKNACNDLKHNYKIYKTIRENGGWDNWNMVEIANYNCKNSTEARIKEQQHYEELKPSLNCCSPYATKIPYFCSTCNLQFNSLKIYNHHISTHIIETNDMEKVVNNISLTKNNNKFYCNSCDFGCSKKGDWTRHIARPKHINIAKCDAQGTEKTYIYICELCDKKYSSRNGLWKHKQTCNIKNEIKEYKEEEIIYNGLNIKDKDALVIYLLKQNAELQNKIIEFASQKS
jgi:hypothetical protein